MSPKGQQNQTRPEQENTIGMTTAAWCPKSEIWMNKGDSALMAVTSSLKDQWRATTSTRWFETPSCVEEVTSGKFQNSLQPTPTRTPANHSTRESRHRWTASWRSFPTQAVIFSTTNFTAVLNMESIIDSGSATSSQTMKTKWARTWIASFGITSEELPNLKVCHVMMPDGSQSIDVLQNEAIWRHERLRWPHAYLIPRGKERIQENWDEQEAMFRLQTLFKIMFYCARYGRRVREQVLVFGIFPDIDRNSPTCQCNGVSTATDIPEEGLILYPVAVRAPTGHGDIRGNNDVELKSTLLSHPLAPSTVVAMPVCFHITSSRNLRGIWKEGLIPGGLSTSWRIFTFFNPYAPWDPRSWKVTKSVDTRKGGYTCLYIPTEVLMNEFNGR